MKPTHKSLLLIFETVVVFSLGVLGNKVADAMNIEPIVLVLLTSALLLAAIAISITLSKADNEVISQDSAISFRLVQRLPNTIGGMVPIGMFIGLTAGVALGMTIGQVPTLIGGIIPMDSGIYADDVAASISGIGVVFILAIIAKPVLVSGVALGYGIGIAPALLLTAHEFHRTPSTIIGFFLEFLIVALAVARFHRFFEAINAVLTERR